MRLSQMIDAANTEHDPALCNHKITLAHRELAERLRELLGPDAGANFHSWAVLGSKKAGVTIRQEDLDGALKDATRVSGLVGLMVGALAAAATIRTAQLASMDSPTGVALLALGAIFGMVCGAWVGRTIARYSRREAARLVLEGNRLVLDDIGRQTARFVETFQPGEMIAGEALEAFLSVMNPRPAEEGGQALLIHAFRRYAEVTQSSDHALQQEIVYHANLLAILNEHIKLQPYIAGSMPWIVQRCVTQRMLTFDIGPLALSVGHDVPSLAGFQNPPALVQLTDPELQQFFARWDRGSGTPLGSRAKNCSHIEDRMGYIVHLFRLFHDDDAVHAHPFH